MRSRAMRMLRERKNVRMYVTWEERKNMVASVGDTRQGGTYELREHTCRQIKGEGDPEEGIPRQTSHFW